MLELDAERIRLNRLIQAYLRAHALRMPEHERFGPFLAGFDTDSDNPYQNYAIPDDDAVPDATEIDAMIAGFAERGRKPRLEFIAMAAPRVAPLLLGRGFEIEQRFPIMIALPERLNSMAVEGIEIAIAANDSDIVGAANVGAEAYEDATPHPDALRRLVSQGGVLMLARDRTTLEIVGMGMATAAYEGVSEVAGIGVRHRYRRRGTAAALTAAITGEALARGVNLVWLTPGHDDAERIYSRAGFVRASEQLHISKNLAS